MVEERDLEYNSKSNSKQVPFLYHYGLWQYIENENTLHFQCVSIHHNEDLLKDDVKSSSEENDESDDEEEVCASPQYSPASCVYIPDETSLFCKFAASLFCRLTASLFANSQQACIAMRGGASCHGELVARWPVICSTCLRELASHNTTPYGQSGFFYCSNPIKSSVYQVVQEGSNGETVDIEDLIETAQCKFLDFYRRPTPKTFNRNDGTPKTCNDDEMCEGEGNLVIVTDYEELERMSQPKPEMNDVFTIRFLSVPKEIHWFDGRATHTFRCECYHVKGVTGAKSFTLYRAEQSS
ncbi:hypothetical protein AVEN_257101-1 [Araneus ventricosus]|uniref:Uncharacterized protein n=1 Tax=Araneus ventricosus TaxID=182803 RepID=A0A4Y2FWV6_ARAVE|nr:hypothetical protein AVEN_257101-1 [Araneus ventricosus]